MSSIAGQVSDITTTERGFMYGEYCRPEGLETPRQLVIFGDGPYPYNMKGQDPHGHVSTLRSEAMRRPVAIYARGSKVYYDSERDDRPENSGLPSEDFEIGQRLRWNGNKFDPSLDDRGSINLVQNTQQGLRLSSINPNAWNIGANGYRAWGADWVENMSEELKTQFDHYARKRELEQELEQAENEEQEQSLMEQIEAEEQAIQRSTSRGEKFLTFIDLAFGDSILVDYESQTFVPNQNGERSSKVMFLARSVVKSIDGLGIDQWFSANAHYEQDAPAGATA